MMTDIFSIFDPANSKMCSMSSISIWLLYLIPLIYLTSNFWITPSINQWISLFLKSSMFNQSLRTSGNHLKPMFFILPSLFTMIITINLMGLIPYFFSISSHLSFTLSIGIPMWLSMILSGFQFKPKKATANLLPNGAPAWLNPPLIIIESLSIMIRPITLCFRLAANMTAGHIVLSLVGIYSASMFFLSLKSLMFLMLIQTGYIMFELGICFIQAYIFSLLLSLYSDDHPL